MLSSLKLENYRAFKQFEVNDLGRVNLFVGKNNSGKTSILEAAESIARYDRIDAITYAIRRRAEISSSERARLGLAFDICHLFNGHAIDVGSFFEIRGLENNKDLLIRCEIYPYNEALKKDAEMLKLFSEEEELQIQYALSITNNISDEPIIIPLTPSGGIHYDWLRRRAVNKGTADKPINFIRSEAIDNMEMRKLWNEIALTDEENEVIKTLNILEPDIERIAFIDAPHSLISSAGGIFAKLKTLGIRIPIGSFGDGIRHLLGISLATIRSAHGYVMIDEIDTGLHHTVMGDMWRMLIETAKRLDVQVFATTHNSDCVRSLAFLHEQSPELCREVRLHRVEREQECTVVYGPEEIKIAAEQNMELRGW